MKCVACRGRGHHDSGLFMEPCVICGGTGEVESDTPAYEPIKARTNFKRITASPEALVRWVSEIVDFCDRGCSHCPVQEKCLYDSDGAGNKDNDELLLEWLNEESKE